MKTSIIKYTLILVGMVFSLAQAYPPAPYYQIYGTLRNEQGTPLSSNTGAVILSGVYSAFGKATVSNGSVTSVTVINGGAGFTSACRVMFGGDLADGGTPATGIAVLTDGVVTGITVTDGGSGYTGEGIVGVVEDGVAAVDIVRSIIDSSIAPGVNYSLSVPMDAFTSDQFYDVSVMRPMLPFTIRVVIDGVNYVPIQIVAATSSYWTDKINAVNNPAVNVNGGHWAIGLPSGKLRLDLWLGVDANGDGLPDAWQWNVVNSDPTGRLSDFTEVLPGADLSGNGMTNMEKFLTGVYAMELRDGLHFEVDSITDGIAKLHFQAIAGHTYHISTSLDLSNWDDPVSFSVNSDGSDPHPYYLADSSKVLNIYVPLVDEKQNFFKLYVE